MIQLSTIHPRTTIIARPLLGRSRYPYVVTVVSEAGGGDEDGEGGWLIVHSFARLMLSKWYDTDNNQPTDN